MAASSQGTLPLGTPPQVSQLIEEQILEAPRVTELADEALAWEQDIQANRSPGDSLTGVYWNPRRRVIQL